MTEHENTAVSRSPQTGVTKPQVHEFTPAVDVIETEQGILLVADMPGVRSDALDVRVEKGTLVIHGAVDLASPKGQPIYREYNEGNYHRSFSLSEDVDTDRITAEIVDGVLKIEIPKAERAKPRRIEIRKR